MNIKYSLFNPNGNITALVETAIDPSRYPFVAKELMKREPSCEQVGFVNDHELIMAGGEFCGNAGISAASRLALCDCAIGENKKYILTVSGAEDPVSVQTEKISDSFVSATVSMPKATFVQDTQIKTIPMTVVSFRGITHAVYSECLTVEDAEQWIKKLCTEYHADAFGLIFYDKGKNMIRPLVYVPTSDTLFWESSCASGTAAVGIALAQKSGSLTRTKIHQPVGALDIEIKEDGTPLLSGTAERIKTDVLTLDF